MGRLSNYNMSMGLLLYLVAAGLHGAASQSGSPRGQLAGMAVTFGQPDWVVTQGTSKCIEQVNRIAKRLGTGPTAALGRGSSIKFAPYFFYSWELPADQAPEEDNTFRHVVRQWLVMDGEYKQVPPTLEVVEQYTADFTQCLSRAISLGFSSFFINPMIDADYDQPECCPWRNAAEFDPTAEITGDNGLTWSYESLIMQPTLEAIKAAVNTNRGIVVSFGLGGEQGRSFTVYGDKWMLLTSKAQAFLKSVVDKSAVGPHFDKELCGTYCGWYSSSTRVTAEQWSNFREFLQAADVFGVSSYPNVWDRYNPSSKTLDVTQSARALDVQLQQFADTSISALRGAGKSFILSEIGLGGCKEWDCNGTNTPDIYELSINAWSGQGSYESYTEPPVVVDAFRYQWTKTFRQEWWRQQLRFFKDTNNPYRPDSAYFWSVGSWDIAAIYHTDSKGENPDGVGCDPKNSYCDPETLDMIKAFNKLGKLPTNAFFNLPGKNYYVKPATRVRVRTAQTPTDNPCNKGNVPGWAKPLVCSRHGGQ